MKEILPSSPPESETITSRKFQNWEILYNSGLMTVEFQAHSSVAGRPPEPLREHLRKVSERARDFAALFGAGEMARAAGMLHDLGKYSVEFQQWRLCNPDFGGKDGVRKPAPHSAFGAQEAMSQWKKKSGIAKIIAWCVAGHHSGLANHAQLEERLSQETADASAWKTDNLPPLPDPVPPEFCRDEFSGHFLTRMLFSCLVDADRLEAEKHFNPDSAHRRKNRPAISELRDALSRHLEDLERKATPSQVNQLRAEVLRACRKDAESKPGFFSLSVPTGGGKTLSSAAFALNHAAHNDMRRVLYAIPFTSIIEQTAEVFRKPLGDRAVLEHHCNYEPDNADGDPEENRLAAENWDAPLIISTNVQLFESLFAARASRCRKLHNLANSVIVLDEAQSLPDHLLLPCLKALDELVKNYGVSVVFCTATLPDFRALGERCEISSPVHEIIPNPDTLHDQLRRVTISPPSPAEFTPQALADELAKMKSVLCIVNTRAQARDAFAALCEQADEGECFHLSTWMHPNHRTKTLNAIREKLRRGQPCKAVSTSLVEAGVDVDFPAVWRATAKWDSIAQAAGRCNREGKMETGEVVVFRMAGGGRDNELWQPNGHCTEAVNCENPLAPKVVRKYFDKLFDDLGPAKMDEKRILSKIKAAGYRFRFQHIADAFRMIDDDASVPVVIPEGGGKDLAEVLWNGEDMGGAARRAQQWSVSVSRADAKEKLIERGLAEKTGDNGQFLLLKNPARDYDSQVGIAKLLV